MSMILFEFLNVGKVLAVNKEHFKRWLCPHCGLGFGGSDKQEGLTLPGWQEVLQRSEVVDAPGERALLESGLGSLIRMVAFKPTRVGHFPQFPTAPTRHKELETDGA